MVNLLSFFFFLSFSLLGESTNFRNSKVKLTASFHVGVVLDLNSNVGEMAQSCISMALSDFYDAHTSYSTRLSLHTMDSKDDAVGAASAALYCLKKEVQAIIGPQKSSQAQFVIDLGNRSKVPIVSFSATSPALSPTKSPYFVRTTQDDSDQVKAITSLVQAFGWKEVVLIYEDTDYGTGVIPYFIDAFQEIDVRVPYRSVIPLSASDDLILKELYKMKTMQSRVFLVHMTASIGSQFFIKAKVAGMMEEEYAWIVTSGLSSLLDPVEYNAIDSMQGVLGVRPYIPKSKKLEDFKVRWKSKLLSQNPNRKINDPSLFGVWAYDTVWALAMAVERVGTFNARFLRTNNRENLTDLSTVGYSPIGPKLLKTILNTRFKSLSGDFYMVRGQLQSSVLQIFNVIGKEERVIGFWTATEGISRYLNTTRKLTNSTSMVDLKAPIWPGDTTTIPKGWVIPTSGKRLRILVPVKDGFREFGGLSIDVFRAVIEKLPFAVPYDFIADNQPNGGCTQSYDDLLQQVYLQNFDAVVGDTTIVANRSLYVDFTLPYSESGVSMVVPIKHDAKKNSWIFLKPLSWDLWLTTGLAFIFTGIVVWILEHRINTEFRGPPGQQLGTVFWFSFSTLVFAHREKVVNNLSRFVLIIWVFVVLIITQSYTANLASMLTVQRLQPTITDINDLIKNKYYVGYQEGSFVQGLLIKQLHFDESRLKPYVSPEEFNDALSNGSVAAIFDEIPYIKLFLNKYCSKYIMVGPTYKTDGFGFAFPLGSPLVQYISRAILNFTEDGEMENIEKKWLEQQAECQDQSARVSSTSHSLTVRCFGGLFLITGLVSGFSLFIYLLLFLYQHWDSLTAATSTKPIWDKLVHMVKHFDKKDLSSHPFERAESRVRPVTDIGD